MTYFVEPFCGMAAVSLKLLGNPQSKPPVSRHGAKTGYALSILAAMGLSPGMEGFQVVLNDVDPYIYNLWSNLSNKKTKEKVVNILDKWNKCKVYQHVIFPEKANSSCPHCRGLGRRVEKKLYEELVDAYNKRGGLWPGAKGIAQWLVIRAWSRVFEYNKPPELYLGPDRPSVARKGLNTCLATRLSGIKKRTDQIPDLSGVVILNSSADQIKPIPESYLYLDPPYVEGLGYSTEFPRSRLVEMAMKWDSVGAVVCISETEKVIDDWYSIDISGYKRSGGKRSKAFHEGKSREILTINRMPASII